MKKIIRQEVEKRGNNDDDAYKLIGAEIKRRRVSQSQTLSSVATDVCSISYLCKVEKNQLKPNRHMLKEICKRLNIESPKMNLLFKMKEMIIECAYSYSKSEMNKIEDYYLKCKGFDNYKSLIISFIYYISKKNIKEANEIGRELIKLINVMRDTELNIFIVFYSILLYYQENYEESISNLFMALKQEKDDEIILLINRMLFSCYYKLNSPLTIKYGEIVINRVLEKLDIKLINEYRYYLCLFYIKNHMYEECEECCSLLTDEDYKENVLFILSLIFKKKMDVDIKKLRPFERLLYIYNYKRNEYRTCYHNIKENDFLDLDFNDVIAGYLTLNTVEDRYKDLCNIYLPIVIKTKNAFNKKFVINELCKLSMEFGRYKPFVKSYMDLIKDGELF